MVSSDGRTESRNRSRGGLAATRAAVLAALCLSILFPARAGAELIDMVVAVVDREVILRSDLIIEARDALTELRDTVVTQDEFEREIDVVLRSVLDQQIEAKLLLRQAEFLGASVTNDELEDDIADLRGELSYDEFLQVIRQEGLTMPELRERRRQIILSRRMALSKQREIAGEVIVTEEEVRDYYEAHRDEFERPEEVLVSQIQFQVGPDEAARGTARARLELLRRELEAGADFAELARTHSQDMFAADGGTMGWHKRGLLQPALEDAVFALPAGEVTEVLESRNGLHLMRVDERRDAGLRDIADVRSEIANVLRSEAALERYERWLADIRKRSRVRVLL